MTRTACRWLGILVCCCGAATAAAQEAASAAAPIDELVRQLDSESFAERKAASEKLAKLGEPAIEALSKAATGPSAEASMRALDILRQHHQSSDAGLRSAAKLALEQLAGSEGASARRAADVLKPKPVAQVANPNQRLTRGVRVLGGAAPLRLAPAAIEVRAIAKAAAARRMSVRTVGGVKQTEVEEGDRKVQIVQDPEKGITVKVTDKKDGKEETKTYEAKDAAELKTKHPEGHKLLEQYGGGGAAAIRADEIRIAVGGAAGGIELGGLPVPVPGVPGVRLELPAVRVAPARPAAPVPAAPVPAAPAPAVEPKAPAEDGAAKERAERTAQAQREVELAAEALSKTLGRVDDAETKKAIERLRAASEALKALRENK